MKGGWTTIQVDFLPIGEVLIDIRVSSVYSVSSQKLVTTNLRFYARYTHDIQYNIYIYQPFTLLLLLLLYICILCIPPMMVIIDMFRADILTLVGKG